MTRPRVLVAGTSHPTSSVDLVERAFQAVAEVSYIGTPWELGRTGYTTDVDVSAADADLLFFVEEWFPFFPRGLERAPFPTAAFFADVMYDLPRRLAMAPFFDHVFVAHKNYVDTFRAAHPSVHWLPFAASADLYAAAALPRDLDLAFVGTVAGQRVRLLERLEREFSMNDFRRLCDLPELARTYQRAKVAINRGETREINLRVFEATAGGAALVTQEAPGLEELFEPGREIVTYRDDDEAVDAIRRLLGDDERRRAIGEAGCRACLSRHTWAQRVEYVMDIVRRAPDQRPAPARRWSDAEVLVNTAAVFASFPMIDALCRLIGESGAPRRAKVRAMGYLARAIARGIRRLGWRRFLRGRVQPRDNISARVPGGSFS